MLTKTTNSLVNEEIPIFFSCDDNYIPFLAVSLESLEENASKNHNYAIKVMHANNISAENQKRILDEYNVDNFHVEFVNITNYVESFSSKLHTRDYYSKSTYYRLFIPNLYPQYKKALYLDSDIVVLGDISKLYHTELGNDLVGAIPDESVQLIKEFQEYVVNRIGVKTSEHYFNAGILLMNLEEMRKMNFENVFLKLLTCVTFDVAQDQDYLNAICRERVTYISNTWNKMPFANKKIKEKDIELIHYNLDQKPWQKDGILYEEYFWKYARTSGYYEIIMKHKISYTKAQQEKSATQTINLIAKTHEQAMDSKENARIAKIIELICFAEGDDGDPLGDPVFA